MRSKEKIKIAYIHHGSARGGAPLSLLYLLKSLPKNDFEIFVLTARADTEVFELFNDSGFPTSICKILPFQHTTLGYYTLQKPGTLKQAAKFFLHLRKNRKKLQQQLKGIAPDIIHLNSLVLAPYAAAAKELKIKTILHVREPVVEGLLGLRKAWLQKHIESHVDATISICEDNQNRLSLKRSQASVIYNPIDFKKFDRKISQLSVRKVLGIPQNSAVTLFAGGSVSRVKGITHYLSAMYKLLKTEPNLYCLMPSFNPKAIASNKRSADIHELFSLFPDKSRIVFSEFVYDIENWIAASDIVYAPHIEPHFSRTIIEAGAMAKPVIAFSIGGISEVVEDGVTGMLVKTGDTQGLIEASRNLFSDPKLMKKMGMAGYNKALQNYDSIEYSSKVAQIYQQLIP